MLKAWNFTKINSAKHALIIIQGKVSKQYSQERLQVDTFESYFNVRFMFGQFRQLFGVWCCNFCYLFILPLFIVLCVRLKICRSNVLFFLRSKMYASEKLGTSQRFCAPDWHQCAVCPGLYVLFLQWYTRTTFFWYFLSRPVLMFLTFSLFI